MSPVFTVPGGANHDHTTLWFWHWHQLGAGDEGWLQVSLFDGAKWGLWRMLDVPAPEGTSTGGWRRYGVDITPYAGNMISVGFVHSTNKDISFGAGWFFDEVTLETAPDTDADGLINFLELAFGTNPNVPDRAAEPRPVKEGGYLTMTINKQPGYSYTVESGDRPHALWWDAANTTVLINNATTLKVRDNVLIGAVPNRFMHVVVTSP